MMLAFQQTKDGEWLQLLEGPEWDALRERVAYLVPLAIDASAKGKSGCTAALMAWHEARGELGAVADALFVGKHKGAHPIPSLASVAAGHRRSRDLSNWAISSTWQYLQSPHWGTAMAVAA